MGEQDEHRKQQEKQEKNKAPAKAAGVELATTGQKVWLAMLLAALTGVVLFAWFRRFEAVQAVVQREHVQEWERPDGVRLEAGPPSFRYDAAARTLRHRGPVDAERKRELLDLLKAANDSGVVPVEARAGYTAAIDALAYDSNAPEHSVFGKLLWLGGLSAMLGVLLRSMVNFVGVACFLDKLELKRYWPWYAMRPVVGILIGVFLIVLVQGNLISPSESAPTGTVAWLGLAFLAGFGASEFTQRLRQVTQTLFGEGKGGEEKQEGGGGDGDRPGQEEPADEEDEDTRGD